VVLAPGGAAYAQPRRFSEALVPRGKDAEPRGFPLPRALNIHCAKQACSCPCAGRAPLNGFLTYNISNKHCEYAEPRRFPLPRVLKKHYAKQACRNGFHQRTPCW